jgi:hypothetical protein
VSCCSHAEGRVAQVIIVEDASDTQFAYVTVMWPGYSLPGTCEDLIVHMLKSRRTGHGHSDFWGPVRTFSLIIRLTGMPSDFSWADCRRRAE